jgi:hypothetical protein
MVGILMPQRVDQIPYRAFRETLSLLGYQDVRAGRGEASESRVPR